MEQDEVAAEAERCASAAEPPALRAVVQAEATCTQVPALARLGAAAASPDGTACSVSPAAEAAGWVDTAVAEEQDEPPA